MIYIINGKTQVGWRIDKIPDSDDQEDPPVGMEFLKSYVAFVREKDEAEKIVKLLNLKYCFDPRHAKPCKLPCTACDDDCVG